jgi:hypothetical protein
MSNSTIFNSKLSAVIKDIEEIRRNINTITTYIDQSFENFDERLKALELESFKSK